MICKLKFEEKDIFLELARSFYSSEAVLHSIPVQYHENTFNELMRSDQYIECFIFRSHEGEVAGYGLISKTFSQESGGMVIWVEELFVLPRYRCCGFGSEFFAYLEKEIPASRYRLEIEPDNDRAVNLYKRRGYQALPYLQMVKEAAPVLN